MNDTMTSAAASGPMEAPPKPGVAPSEPLQRPRRRGIFGWLLRCCWGLFKWIILPAAVLWVLAEVSGHIHFARNLSAIRDRGDPVSPSDFVTDEVPPERDAFAPLVDHLDTWGAISVPKPLGMLARFPLRPDEAEAAAEFAEQARPLVEAFAATAPRNRAHWHELDPSRSKDSFLVLTQVRQKLLFSMDDAAHRGDWQTQQRLGREMLRLFEIGRDANDFAVLVLTDAMVEFVERHVMYAAAMPDDMLSDPQGSVRQVIMPFALNDEQVRSHMSRHISFSRAMSVSGFTAQNGWFSSPLSPALWHGAALGVAESDRVQAMLDALDPRELHTLGMVYMYWPYAILAEGRSWTSFMSAASTAMGFQLAARQRTAAVGLACLIYRAERGSLPEKLEDLVPAYLPAVPVDPYSREGEAIRLFADAERYTVYSIGKDMKDNGGAIVELKPSPQGGMPRFSEPPDIGVELRDRVHPVDRFLARQAAQAEPAASE